MNFQACAELVLEWQNLPFTLPNLEKAKDSIIGVRATMIEQSIDKNNRVLPTGLKQKIRVPLVIEGKVLVSDIIPRLLLKADTVRITVEFEGREKQIDIVSKLDAELAEYKRLTANIPRAYISEQKVTVTKGLFTYIDVEGIFQNPLAVVVYQGNDADSWEIEESLFGQLRSFFVPNIKSNDGGEIRITESDVQNNAQRVQG